MRNLLARFARSEDGNYFMLTAIVSSVVLGAVGLGVNLGQIYHTQSNLRHALDAAVTSTARDLTTGRIAEKDARDTVQRLLQSNSTGGYAISGALSLDTLAINRVDNTVVAEASANVDVAFPLFGMGKRHRVLAESAALYSDRKIEIAMMLDITGSMGEKGTSKNGKSQTKLDNLKDAASDAITDLLARNVNGIEPRLRVALVPYAAGVNAGSLSDSVYYEGAGVPSGAPIGLLALNQPINRLLKTALGIVKALVGDNCSTERKDSTGGADLTDTSPYDTMVNRDNRFSGCPKAEVIPLTADASRLKQAVTKFKAEGTTAGHIGIQWTQYMLSPKWGAYLKAGAPSSAPAAYEDRKVKKIAILMTDGEFNTAYAGVRSAGNTSESARKSPEYAKNLCNRLKANGIEVFTIGFMLDQDGAKATMANCATPDAGGVRHYFDASNGKELNEAFDSITANIEQVRLIN